MSDTVFMDCSNFFLLTHCEAVIDHDDWQESSAEARGICIGPFGDERVLAERVARETSMDSRFAARAGGGCIGGQAQGVRG